VNDHLSVLVYGESMMNAPIAILSFSFFYQMEHLEGLAESLTMNIDTANLGGNILNTLGGESENGPFLDMLIKAAKAIACGVVVAATSSVVFRIVGSHAPPLTVISKLSEKQQARALEAGSSGTIDVVDSRLIVQMHAVPDHISIAKLRIICRDKGGHVTAITLRKKSNNESWAMVCFDEFEDAHKMTAAEVVIPANGKKGPWEIRCAFAEISEERLTGTTGGHGSVAAVYRDICKGVKAQKNKTALECIVFYLLAISSFYLAEGVRSNGIIGAWICGLCTKHWTLHNLSKQGANLLDGFLANMSTL
jgi:hypothetical protein